MLTGTDHHIVGLGTMAESLTDELRGRPAMRAISTMPW